MSEWKPIESAPTYEAILGSDGTIVAALMIGSAREAIDWTWGYYPTHWMPLPAPPEGE